MGGDPSFLSSTLTAAKERLIWGPSRSIVAEKLANALRVEEEITRQGVEIRKFTVLSAEETNVYTMKLDGPVGGISKESLIHLMSSTNSKVETQIPGVVIEVLDGDILKVQTDRQVRIEGFISLDLNASLKPIRVKRRVIERLDDIVVFDGKFRLADLFELNELPQPGPNQPITHIQPVIADDPDQCEAVRKALSVQPFVLIRGPPGTGKTTVIAEIAAQMILQGKKVLVASQSNPAVDNALETLDDDKMMTGIEARLGRKPEFMRVTGFLQHVSEKIRKYSIGPGKFQDLVNEKTKEIKNNCASKLEELKNRLQPLESFLHLIRQHHSLVEAVETKTQALEKSEAGIEYVISETDRKMRERDLLGRALKMLAHQIEVLSDQRDEMLRRRQKVARLETNVLKRRLKLWGLKKSLENTAREIEKKTQDRDELAPKMVAIKDAALSLETRKMTLQRTIEDLKSELTSDRLKIAQLSSSISTFDSVEPEDTVYARNSVHEPNAIQHLAKKASFLRRRACILEEWLAQLNAPTMDLASEIMLEGYDVIGATCVGAGEQFLEKVKFDYVIVDETSKATIPETLIPVSRAERFALVGDEKQLEPYSEWQVRGEFKKQGIDDFATDSLFSYLIDKKLEKRFPAYVQSLWLQHRMNRNIANLVSELFYDGRLQSAPETESRVLSDNPYGKELIWLDTSTLKDAFAEKDWSSLWNRVEAEAVLAVVRRVTEHGCRPDSIGIITPYLAQKRHMQTTLMKAGFSPDLVDTVDAFQGKQRDVIIITMVRTTHTEFLTNLHRLDVALSRARKLLVIVGNLRRLTTPANANRGVEEPPGEQSQVFTKIENLIRRDGEVHHEYAHKHL